MKPKRILIFPEYWLPHVFMLVHGFSDYDKNDDIEVYWSNKKWCHGEFHLNPSAPPKGVQYLETNRALKQLDKGMFDAVVISDGTSIGYLTSHLKGKTKRVFLDTSDTKFINKAYLYFADYYLKCQYPHDRILVGDSTELSSNLPPIPIIPWSYCTSFYIPPKWLEEEVEVEPKVYFRGWCGNAARSNILLQLKKANIPLEGGLHLRDNIPISNKIPKNLQAKRISFQEYIKEMRKCQIALNLLGNGEMCFRTHEIWQSGICMVSQKIDVVFPSRKPKNGMEWVECENTESIIEVCRNLLENPQKCLEIGLAGKKYWEQYGSPKFAAKRLLQLLGWEEEIGETNESMSNQ